MDDWTLAQVARGSGALTLADIQNPPGSGSEQPTVADPALNRGDSGELNGLQEPLPPHSFCDCVML